MFRRMSPWLPGAVALVVLSWAAADARAQNAVPTQEVDRNVRGALIDAMTVGVPLFNGGDRPGCYRVYQGAVVAVVRLLDHRPDLRDFLKKSLAGAEAKKSFADKAHALREAMDVAVETLARKSLWERLGGEKVVRAVVDDFVVKAAANPKVNFDRNGKFKLTPKALADLKQKLVEAISVLSGGPLKYTGRDMKAAHLGMGVTDAEFTAMAYDLVDVMMKRDIPIPVIQELIDQISTTREAIVEKKSS